MKIRSLLGFFAALAAFAAHTARAQFTLDCTCLATQAVLTTNACQAVIPDLCQFTNCYQTTIVPPPPLICNQNPAPGTPVGPGIHAITVSVFVPGTLPQSCALVFQVNPPPGGCAFALICASNKTVECGSLWTFDPPGWTNECPNPNGTPPNVTLTILSTVTNGACPWTATQTWQGVDDCGNVATCSQTVTVVDTLPPTLNCICLTNAAALPPPPMIVTNCTGTIPDLCPYGPFCSFDQCGPLTCTQTPPAGTVVGVGVHPFTVSVFDCAGNSVSCTYNFIVIAPPGGCITNPCPLTLAAVLNTGTAGGNGAVLAPGAPEQVWVNVAAPGGPAPMVVADPTGFPIVSGPWVGPNATSAWVAPAVNTQGPAGWYTNRAIFNAPCPTVCLRGRIASDDDGYFYVNGVLVSGAGFTFWSNINHCANFVTGPNMIEFVVHNAGGPTGFRTELEFLTQCCCESQTNVFNSGMGGSSGNVPLGTGTPDPNYVLISAPPGGCIGPAQVLNPSTLPSPPWVANGPNSQWIGAGPSSACQEGVYHFRLCFYLPCADGASIVGQWAVDDNGSIHLNGQPTGNTIPSQQFPNLPGYGWFPVSITNGFVCGTNCLDFYVTNALIGVNPTGFRAELTNIFNDCCCPTPQPLFSVFSGQNSTGPLTSGAPDPQFTFTCAPPGVTTTTPVVTFPHPLWIPNGPNSQWIGPNQFNYAPAGVYCYTMQFVIPCPPGIPIKASLTGQWSADDTGTINLNGQPTGNTLPNGWAFLNWSPINITSGFVSGVNTLTFYVTNAGGPTGLRVELTGAASCCACTNPPDCSCNFTNGDFNTFVPVNATGGGWTSSGVFGGAGWQASGGNPGATFLLNNVGDPATDPTISQTICCLTPGQCYTLRGQRKVQAWFGQTQPSFAVLLDGTPILTLSVPSNPADANWYDFAVSFTATNRCQTIGFAAEYGGTDVSYWIDNIRLECCQTNSCIDCPPLQQAAIGCPPVMPNFTTNRFSGPGCTPIGPLVVTQSVPPGTLLRPGSTTVVIIRVCDARGQCRDCDVIVTAVSTAGLPTIKCPNDIVRLTCTNAATVYYTPTAAGHVGPVLCLPPSGTVFPLGTYVVTCRVTNQCGARAICTFNVAVRPQRPQWLCPWIAIGISATPLGQAQLTSRPNLGSSGQDGIALDNLGSSGQDGVRLDFGPAQKFTFSTVLDFNAPEGTTFDIALPPDPANPNGVPLLSFARKSGPKGYCVKTNKRFTEDPAASYRHTCIESNGDLHTSITWDANDMDTNVLFNLFNQPEVDSVVMTVELDCLTREVTVAFPHCLWTTDAGRKGWDGCIYGNRPPSTKATGRLVLTPVTPVVSPPITTLDLHSTSTGGQIFDDPSILARGGCKGGDGHITLMKAFDDGDQRGFQFTSFGHGGGIHLDLGFTEAFNLRLQKFETGDEPTQDDLITHTLGGIRVDGRVRYQDQAVALDTLLLRGGSNDVECSADFNNIGSPTVHVQVLLQGMVVADRTGVPGLLSNPVLVLPEWPSSLGKLGGAVTCRSGTVRPGPIRLPGGGGGLAPDLGATPDETVIGDEFRILAEMPPGAPPPDFYYTGIQFLASDGPTWVVTNPQRTLACPPTALTITRNADGSLQITWPDAAFRLQGAEEVTGPWYNLGVDAPATLPAAHPARFFRVLCD